MNADKEPRSIGGQPQAAKADDAGQELVQQDVAGWDPYEVWRTRVLLPRQMKTQHRLTVETRAETGVDAERHDAHSTDALPKSA